MTMAQNTIKSLSTLNLKRALYGKQEPINLFPFDAADEYILETLQSPEFFLSKGPILIFNDAFGALSTALSNFKPYHVTDSFVSQLALRQNLKINQLDENSVVMLDSLAPLPDSPSLILLKIPKSLSFLNYQIEQIKAIMTESTNIIAGAKAQDIHTSTLTLFEKIGKTKTSLAKKKARLVFCTPNIFEGLTSTKTLIPQENVSNNLISTSKELQLQGKCNTQSSVKDNTLIDSPSFDAVFKISQAQLSLWRMDDSTLVSNYPNVFSRGQLDIGARFFLEYLPSHQDGTLVDLGCGNGVIGLRLLKNNPEAKVIFVDESYMAIASSRLNVLQNRSQDLPRSEFLISDALHEFTKDSVDMVLCNPPFHQQNTLTNHIAKSMFYNSLRSLKVGGKLLIVSNRHLNYFQQLKGIFGNCSHVASNKKFVILQSIKK